MGIVKRNKQLPRLLCLLTFMTALTGCIKDDLDDCEQEYRFTVRAYDADNGEVTTPVNEVLLYVFDDNLQFIKEIETTIGASVSVSVPRSESIHVVGWGNLKGGNQVRPTLVAGDHKDTGLVRLNAVTRTASPHGSPDDLFHGDITINAQDMRENILLPIHRKVSSLAVTVIGLKQYAGFDDDDYRIEVHETRSAIDFYGQYCGNGALYSPAGAFHTQNGKEAYRVSAFHMLPQNSGVSIDIFHRSTLVYTATTQGNGSPIIIQEGRHTDVVIDFTGSIRITVSISPWGGNQGGIEF